MLISDGYQPSYQASEDLRLRVQSAQPPDGVQAEPWLPSMGMTMVHLCPMGLDPMVDHPADVWTLLLTPSASCAPSRDHLSSPDLPRSLWRICQGLSVLDFAPEPDARLGCEPGGPVT